MNAEQRFPSIVYRHGCEPDPRFSLANERTFLAWVRTSLALFATAGVLLALKLPMHPAWQTAAVLTFALASAATAAWAFYSWAATERMLRLQRSLPGLRWGALVSVAVVAGVMALMIGFAVHELF